MRNLKITSVSPLLYTSTIQLSAQTTTTTVTVTLPALDNRVQIGTVQSQKLSLVGQKLQPQDKKSKSGVADTLNSTSPSPILVRKHRALRLPS